MREMQTGGIKGRRTKGGIGGVKEAHTDVIIKQDGGMYSVDLLHKSVRQQTLTPHTQIDVFCYTKKMRCPYQASELPRQMFT